MWELSGAANNKLQALYVYSDYHLVYMIIGCHRREYLELKSFKYLSSFLP